jgi:ubiquitin-activating enzyme E1
MTTERYDRQDRVYGIDGTKRLQNAHVRIKGPISDLTYEVAKNLALSGINNIKMCLDNSANQTAENKISNFQPGKVHMIKPETLLQEISKLNPYLQIESIDSKTFYSKSDDILVFVGPTESDKNFMSDSKLCSDSNKIICFWASKSEQDKNNSVKFYFFNDFKSHLVTDIDGENYELMALGEVKKKSETIYELKTSSPHNLSRSDLLTIKLDHHMTPFKIRTKSVINSHTFEIESDANIDLSDKFESYINGYVCRSKEPMQLNHKLFGQFEHPTINSQLVVHNLSPLVQYYFGAIISSEVIKAITSKYVPFNQTYEFEFDSDTAFGPVVGSELESKLHNLKCFMVGSGAIGCELLKNLVSVNAAILPGSYIKVTDPDHIEVSNLSRQFLFRSENVGNSKSEVAANRIRIFNPETNIIAYQEKLSDSNQKFVNDNFAEVDVLLNALDNISARLYVDTQAVKLCKPLFESGTLGTKGNTQPVIPHITESYGASQDQAQEQSFPACTLKNFPSLIQHTIHWAMDDFDGLFNKQPQMLKRYIKAFDDGMKYEYLDSLDSIETNLIKNNTRRLISKLYTVSSLTDYVKWAYQLWTERFVSRIQRLLKAHPSDSEVDGRPFWSNGKKCPTIRQFNIGSETDISYIKATTRLLVATYNVLESNTSTNTNSFTDDDIYNSLESVLAKNYTVSETYSDDPDLFEDLQVYPHQNDIEKLIDLSSRLNVLPQEFEKDDDSNYHIMFVQSTSNSRAINYLIPIASFFETKGIAGRIIPALATTTSIVASLITMEMLKFLANPTRPIESYRSSFINLADNMIIQSEPMPCQITDTNGMKFTEWGPVPKSGSESGSESDIKLESSKEMLLSEFIKTWGEKFNCQKITMVLVGSKILYMEEINESNLGKKISELINSEDDMLSIGTEDENIVLPDIRLV